MFDVLAQAVGNDGGAPPWTLIGAVVALAGTIGFLVRLFVSAFQKNLEQTGARADKAIEEANSRADKANAALIQALPILESVRVTMEGSNALTRELLEERRRSR